MTTCIVLSHRRREFLETTLASLREHATGIDRVIIVDDSGDSDHRHWLDEQHYEFAASSDDGSSVGYLDAMRKVWQIGSEFSEPVLLWEEDFILIKSLNIDDMACVLNANHSLAQLNLQRQPVYKIERRLGYMQSHARRGYGIVARDTEDIRWVRRLRPFTTNPSLIKREVLETPWPTRAEADKVAGGAEPAMSQRLERQGYTFGWLGIPNQPHTHHVGDHLKTGKGY